MDKDAEKVLHWIVVPQWFAIQALVVQNELEKRLYIVTEDTPAEYSWGHDKLPKIVGAGYENRLFD